MRKKGSTQIKNVNDVAYCMEKKTFSLSSTILPANLIIFILSRTICHILAYTLFLYTFNCSFLN